MTFMRAGIILTIFCLHVNLFANEPLKASFIDFLSQEKAKSFADKRIEIKGFLTKSSDGQFFLTSRPDVKSCCCGKKDLVLEQIALQGLIEIPNGCHLVTIQGIFRVQSFQMGPGTEHKKYALDQPILLTQEKRHFTPYILALSLFAAGAYFLFRFRRQE